MAENTENTPQEQTNQEFIKKLRTNGASTIKASLVLTYYDAWWSKAEINNEYIKDLKEARSVNEYKKDEKVVVGDIVYLCIQLQLPDNFARLNVVSQNVMEDLLTDANLTIKVFELNGLFQSDDECGSPIAKINNFDFAKGFAYATVPIKLYKPADNASQSKPGVYELDITKAMDEEEDRESLKLYVELPKSRIVTNRLVPFDIKGEQKWLKKDKCLEVMIPKFIDGIWLYDRHKEEGLPEKFNLDTFVPIEVKDQGIEDFFEHKIEHKIENTAFGMKVAMRVKAQYISQSIDEIFLEVFEENKGFRCSEDIRLKRITKNTESGISIFQTRNYYEKKGKFEEYEIISKIKYFDPTGVKDGQSAFYFNAYMTGPTNPNDGEKRITKKEALPKNKTNYLKIDKPGSINEQVIKIAQLYLDENEGWNDHLGGTPEVVYHNKPNPIFKKGSGKTFCSAFTFWVAMRVLQSNAVLEKKKYDIEKLRLHFWGNAKDAKDDLVKQCVNGIVELGLGKEIIDQKEWKPGDFMQMITNPNNGDGHSVVFAGLDRDSTGKIIGMSYISSQDSTGGMNQYSIPNKDYRKIEQYLNEKRKCYVARLNDPPTKK